MQVTYVNDMFVHLYLFSCVSLLGLKRIVVLLFGYSLFTTTEYSNILFQHCYGQDINNPVNILLYKMSL